ncbi:uncharacterized protein LOC105162332 [Sesamum indicum]|uniref:Uncharacterized protein LOC105162332 n=1 Tax=Sesamum indicum TaxID=4182 RepID=A0A6I9T8P4_SESIN|nr:uncharacterized protein LOC105162332 [Sesamum indicum]
MGRTANEENSDGIEIISIGKLYTGPWDKKYWSSSRGKDRYPYPVGFKSLRTQNGVTYMMEVQEGLKGPSFTISSTDGKSCCGDTPDMAWENLQKKGCSKLWHGKRFSCKIDGVEFFGFKNTFVQRLMRELVANVGGTAEQSLLPSNFLSGACQSIHQLQCKASGPDPDLLKYLARPRITGKRSRKYQVVNSKRLNGTHFEHHQQENCKMNASISNSNQGDQSNCGSSDPSSSAAASEVSQFRNSREVLGPEHSAAITENGNNLPVAERGFQDSLVMPDHLKVGGDIFQERELMSSMNHVGLDVDNLLQNQEPSGKSRNIDVQVPNNLLPEEMGGETNVQHGMLVANDADLWAPDTLDHAGDSSSVHSPKNDVELHWIVKDAIVNDVTKSVILATDSLLEDEKGTSVYNPSSEKSDTDSVGQEIAKSMMTVLLPRAVPLLKTFTRKKKKSANTSKIPPPRSQEENKMTNISMNDATIAREVAEHSDLWGKNGNACIPCAGHDSVVSTSGNSDSVVPDSFENETDNPQDLLPLADAFKAGQVPSGIDPCARLPTNGNAEANPLLSSSGIREHVINLHSEGQTVLSEKPIKDSRKANAMLVVTTDAILPHVMEITADSKTARFDCNSMDKLPSTHASSLQGTSRSESKTNRSFSDTCIPEKSDAEHKDKDFADCNKSGLNFQIKSTSYSCSVSANKKMIDDSRSNGKVKLKSKLQGLPELFACYVHPMPVSMVELIGKENEIFICVKCGHSEQKENILFVYRARKNGEDMRYPSLIGHVPIALQIPENVLGRNICVERSSIQLTPDGESLVLLNSTKVPHCREGKLHCSCPACTSDCFEENGVKIVKLSSGYASLVTRLETTQGVCCLLVCEPNILLAAEEGGKVKLWGMNSGWSGQKEDLYLPTFDCVFPSIVDLKRIPKSTNLVIGHNGYGEFGLWDIDKRHLVSRFSSPGMSFLECVPASIFRWQIKGECKTGVLINEIMDATRNWFSGRNENQAFSPKDKDVAIWLLISTAADPDSQCYKPCEQEANLGRCWRLALLVNNTVIIGSALDGGAAAVTSDGHGIIGRSDGLVYMWELSTGTKLGNLHSFKGSRVSCITTDTSNSGALAIASGGQLLVYLPAILKKPFARSVDVTGNKIYCSLSNWHGIHNSPGRIKKSKQK